MNVGTLKAVAYLTSVGMLGGIVYVGYEFFTKEVKEMAQGVDHDHTLGILEDVTAPSPPKIVGLDYRGMILPAIRDFDWTGAPPPPPPPPVDPNKGTEELEKKAIPIEDIVTVLAVLGDLEDEGNSFALLGFKPGSTGAERGPGYYYVGDSLPKPDDNIAVFAIRDGGVEFSFADDEREREFLLPPSVSDRVIERVASLDDVKRRAERLNFEASVAAARGDADANAQTEKVNGVFQIGPGDANTFAQDYQRILSEDVSLQTYRDPETGKKAGIKVSSVRPGSIAARHGAMDGDIIISINGDSVTSEQQAMQYVRERSDQTDVWRVRYIRAGQEREEVYHSPDN